MSWFNNVKLASKLALTFGLCLLLSAIAAIDSITHMQAMNASTKAIVERGNAESVIAGKLGADFRQYRVRQFLMLLAVDPKVIEQNRQAMLKCKDEVQSDLTAYTKLATDSADKANLEQASQAWAAILTFEPRLMKLADVADYVHEHQTIVAFRQMDGIVNGVATPAFASMSDTCNAMVEWNTKHTSELAAQSQAEFVTARNTVALLLLLTLIVGTLAASFVARSITGVVAEIDVRIDSLNTHCIANLLDALDELGKGNFNAKITPRTTPLEIHGADEFGKLSESINGIIAKVQGTITSYQHAQKSLKALIDHAHETVIESVGKLDRDALLPLCDGIAAMADGNLTHKVTAHIEKMEVDGGSDLGKLAVAVNKVGDRVEQAVANYERSRTSLGTLIGHARNSAESINSSATEIATGNEDLSSRTAEQASSLEETAASMEEMTGTVRQNAENAQRASEIARQARDVAGNGSDVVQKAVDAMAEVNEATKRVTDIVSVIDEIAFQTNLLALNAAVEAARVGEQGRGFAVVAAEVRNLAGRSSTAAKEIKSLVEQAGEKVEDGTDLVNQSGLQLVEIVTAASKVAEIVAEIAAASQEQSTGIEQVNKAITQMDEITQQNAALVEEAAASSQNMSHQAIELQQLIDQFKVEDAGNLRVVTSERQSPRRNAPAKTETVLRTGTGPTVRNAGRSERVTRKPLEMEEF